MLTQLAVGTLIELEHTKDRRLAAKIARDHIREIPDYYTRLVKMETAAKSNPMANYHSLRVEEPSRFETFRYRPGLLGRGVDVVFGIPRKGGVRIQSVRFSRKRFSLDKVKAWMARHPMLPGQLEPAANPESATRFIKRISERVKKAAKSTADQERAYRTILMPLSKQHAGLTPVSLLGATSAKVLHSAVTGGRLGYVNAIMYLSPADRAAVSFVKEYPDMVAPLVAAVRKAAASREDWRAFAAYREDALTSLVRQVGTFPKQPTLDTPIPDCGNRILPLSMCPFASPVCRAVCLNTSGRGGFEGKKVEKAAALYRKARAAHIPAGDTLTDDYKRFYLAGHKAVYGGETNGVTAMRCRRTHAMWLSWAIEGDAMQNHFNDLLLAEAKIYAAKAKSLRMPLAIRLNGTSDLPVHSWRTTDGKNLIEQIGRMGIVCYDYTKDFAKYRRWLESRAWGGATLAHAGKVKMVAGFPSNYYLTFSWSETNAKLSLMALRKGGSVVMVFRRHAEPKRGEEVLPLKYGGKGALPTVIPMAQLSDDPADRHWEASVVDGDVTDLRFADKYELGGPMAGVVVALLAKGKARGVYTDKLQRQAWKHFTSPVELRRIGEKVEGIIRSNPDEGAAGGGAVAGLDGDIEREAYSTVNGWQVGTIAMGT